jgi:hypothetical protein
MSICKFVVDQQHTDTLHRKLADFSSGLGQIDDNYEGELFWIGDEKLLKSPLFSVILCPEGRS